MFFKFLLAVLSLSFSLRAQVYDCFLFFNEIEVLELRLEELYSAVDYFVVVEANEGFRGHPKPFNFEANRHKFERFDDKIIFIKLEEHFETDNPWERETWQRNQIMRGLKKATPDDLIIISDVDEFIPATSIPTLYTYSNRYAYIGFLQQMYRWYLNRAASDVSWWAGTIAMRFKELKPISPQIARDLVRQSKITMWYGGWHFSSMGGYERVKEKFINYSHGTDDVYAYERFMEEVNSAPKVVIDGSFPSFVRNNIDYLKSINLIDDR